MRGSTHWGVADVVQDSYRCTVAAMGEDSGEAVLLGLRVGIASLGEE